MREIPTRRFVDLSLLSAMPNRRKRSGYVPLTHKHPYDRGSWWVSHRLSLWIFAGTYLRAKPSSGLTDIYNKRRRNRYNLGVIVATSKASRYSPCHCVREVTQVVAIEDCRDPCSRQKIVGYHCPYGRSRRTSNAWRRLSHLVGMPAPH